MRGLKLLANGYVNGLASGNNLALQHTHMTRAKEHHRWPDDNNNNNNNDNDNFLTSKLLHYANCVWRRGQVLA